MVVQPDVCRICSDNLKTGFLIICLILILNDPQFSEPNYVWANSVKSGHQGLHCLQFQVCIFFWRGGWGAICFNFWMSMDKICHYNVFLPLDLCFHQIKIENNSILAAIPPLGAFFPDLILIYVPPVSLCIGYNLF